MEDVDVPGLYPLGGGDMLFGGHDICTWDAIHMDDVVYSPRMILIVWKM